jgi:rhodanese-related sulfurtransferase
MVRIKEIGAHDLARWLDDAGEKVQVIDVRQPGEYLAGTVPGAELMPLASVPVRTRDIERDRPVVMVCRSGARSAQACAFLAARGHDNVYNLRGGMIAWAGAGLTQTLPWAA